MAASNRLPDPRFAPRIGPRCRRAMIMMGGVLGFASVVAKGATVNLTASADAFVSAANATSNFGGAGALGVAAAGLSKGEFDSLLKFDTASAKTSFDAAFGAGNWVIQSLSLQWTATPPNNAIFNGNGEGPGGTNVNFAGQFLLKWLQSDAWGEGTGTPAVPTTDGVTFSSLGSFLGAGDVTLGTFSSTSATSGSATYPLSLAPALVSDAMAGNLVSFLALPADSGEAYLFSSRSVGTAANRPQLTVTAAAVPEPGVASLLASTMGLCVIHRPRNARRR